MGKGDKKTKKGKIFKNTFGVIRPHKRKTSTTTVEGSSKKKKLILKKSDKIV